MSYSDRLIKLKLDTLYYRRRISDLLHCNLQVFRIINKVDVVNSDTFFIFSDSYTRGNNVKLIKPRADTNIRLHSFTHRIINNWNSLPYDVCAESINVFKSRLKSFWYNKEFKYHFKFYNQ